MIPGGTQPDWGPADVPAGRGASGGGLAVKSADAKLSTALKKGFTVGSAPAAGRLSATATRSGRKVASGSKAVHGHKATVKLRFTRGARNALNNARSVKLRVKVSLGSKSTTLSLKLKR